MKIFDAHSDIWSDVTVQRLRGGKDVLNRRHMERLGKGGVEGSIFVIWVDPPFDADSMARTKDIMASIRAEVAESDAVTVVHSYEEMMAARAAGKFHECIGIEGRREDCRGVVAASASEIGYIVILVRGNESGDYSHFEIGVVEPLMDEFLRRIVVKHVFAILVERFDEFERVKKYSVFYDI